MPYVQTSVTVEELAQLHSRAILARKSLQRLVYEYIEDGLNKPVQGGQNGREGKASEKTGKGNR